MQSLLLLPLLFIELARSQNFSCTVPAPSPGAPPLPNIANQFTTRVEANIENRGYTVIASEYYDEPNNRGRIDFSGGMAGLPRTRIYTYTDNQWFDINGTQCTANLLSPNTSFTGFPVSFDNQGNAHIRGVADVLRFGKTFNETYLGREEVRGITADHWRTCMPNRLSGNIRVQMDWYFAAANWRTTSEGTPLRLVVEGVDQNRPPRNNPTATVNGTHYFKHSYEFVFFTPGPIDNELFQIPRGIFCDGSQVAKDVPPISNQFFARLQAVDALNNTIRHFSEILDTTNQQFWFRSSRNIGIQDFRMGVIFFLSSGNCSTYSLDPPLLKQFRGEGNLAELSPDQQHLQLRPVKDLFGLSRQFNVSYVGTRTVNDIPCDVFQEQRMDYPQLGNITIVEISFARKSFTYFNQSNSPEYQVPVRFEQYSKDIVGRLLDPTSPSTFHQIINIYEFEVTPHQAHNIDIGQCFDSSTNVWFQLDGTFNNVAGQNRDSFVRACTDAVAKAAQVDRSRVTRVQMIPTGNGILVQATLLGFLSNKNITAYVDLGATLDSAVKNLKQAINNGQLQVITKGTQMSYSSVQGSLTTDSPSFQSSSSSSSSGYTGGEMAGVAIAMLIVGLAIGCAVVFLYMRRRATLKTGYGKHNNPM